MKRLFVGAFSLLLTLSLFGCGGVAQKLEETIPQGAATEEEIETIRRYALKVNEFLKAFWLECGVILVDFKLEFGRTADGEIILADEISPDTCRLWDAKTHEKLDKDRFRRDLGGVEDAYKEIMKRLMSHE